MLVPNITLLRNVRETNIYTFAMRKTNILVDEETHKQFHIQNDFNIYTGDLTGSVIR